MTPAMFYFSTKTLPRSSPHGQGHVVDVVPEPGPYAAVPARLLRPGHLYDAAPVLRQPAEPAPILVCVQSRWGADIISWSLHLSLFRGAPQREASHPSLPPAFSPAVTQLSYCNSFTRTHCVHLHVCPFAGYGGEYCQGRLQTVALSSSSSFDSGAVTVPPGRWVYYSVGINTGSLTVGGNTLTFSWTVAQPVASSLYFIFSPMYTNSLGNLYFMPAASWVLNNSAVVPVGEEANRHLSPALSLPIC